MSSPSSSLFELQLRCPQASADTIADALQELGALSVSILDAQADTQNETALFGEPDMPLQAESWPSNWMQALFADQAAAGQAASALQAQDFFADCQILALQTLPAQDWVRLTQAQFEPVCVRPGFWIVPSWSRTPEGAQSVIHLDPGMAFGTGTHPTTLMCLRWLLRQDLQGKRLLDYGCGSGILAIAAAMQGATPVDAVDLDPAALEASQQNARNNQVSIRVGLPDLAQGVYEVLVANILATPLKVLAPLLCQHVQAGGELILAGVLERQKDELQAAYAPWLQLEQADAQEGWILLHGRKRR